MSDMLIGGHLAFSSNLPEDTVFQCFATNNHGHYSPARIESIKQKGILFKSNSPRVIHSSYVTFPWSEKKETRDRSIEDIRIASKIANMINIKYVLVHLSRRFSCVPEFEETVRACFEALEPPCILLFENTTGGIKDKCPELLGTPIHILRGTQKIIEKVATSFKSKKVDWGFCVDTAHSFEQGQPLTTSRDVKQFIEEANGVKIMLIHLNGSLHPFNSGRDKHTAIGSVFDHIWGANDSGLQVLLRWATKEHIPMILERSDHPFPSDYEEEISYARGLMGINCNNVMTINPSSFEKGRPAIEREYIGKTICFLKSNFHEVYSIIDGTAHVGISTASLSEAFPEAYIMATGSKDDALLEKNIKSHGLSKKVRVVKGNIMMVLSKLRTMTNLLFLDGTIEGKGIVETIIKAIASGVRSVAVKLSSDHDFKGFADAIGDLEIKVNHKVGEKDRPSFHLLKIAPPTPKNAYVQCIFNDRYLPGALVTSATLLEKDPDITIGKRHSIIMVTRDISKEGREALGALTTRVIEINIELRDIAMKNKKLKERYKDPGLLLARFEALRLTEYKTVFILDSDTTVMENPGSVFESRPPAAEWVGLLAIKEDERSKWSGRRLTTPEVEGRDFRMFASALLLNTSLDDYARLSGIFDTMVGTEVDWLEEIAVTKCYAGEWTVLPYKYMCSWGRCEGGVIIHHYGEGKPWTVKDEWPDTPLWDAAANRLMKRLPMMRKWFPSFRTLIGEAIAIKQK